MRKFFVTVFCCLILFMISCQTSPAKVLMAGVSDSTGIVGIDMIIGQEPIPIINYVFKNTPAEKAGLKAGDRILAVDKTPLYGVSKENVDLSISDVPGTNIHLTILRFGQQLEINLTVAPLHESSETIQNEFAYQ